MLCLASAAGINGAAAADAALIEAARKEGEVTWYSTQIISQLVRPVTAAFERKYPGIKVRATRQNATEVAVKILNEGKAGRLQADVFDGTGSAPPIKKAGLALQWLPDAARRLPKEYVDQEGYWIATNVYVQTPAFNTNLVPSGTQPLTYRDLLDPRWKGKLAWAGHATTSGAPGFIGIVLADMGEEKGMAYLRELAKQKIVAVGGERPRGRYAPRGRCSVNSAIWTPCGACVGSGPRLVIQSR